jgi:ubiquitin carboxyl-terminal hydrolase 9/13
MERREPQFDSVKGKGKDEAPEQHHDAFHYTPGQGFGTFGIANSSTSTMSRAGSNLKRVSRKLSVTSPILGFGRKDKEKQKERDSDKDKGTFPPQNAFPYSGMMAPRI